MIGASIKFREVEASIIPKSIGLVLLGTTVRTAVCFFSLGSNFEKKEKILIACSWIPKATVQAALASVPLDLIKQKMKQSDPNYVEFL